MTDEMPDDLLPPDQRLDLDRVRSLLATDQIGQHLHYLVQTTSTMDDARRLAERGAPHGAAVVADEQTAGRGTKGRIWVSPPGQSIHTTLIVRPDIQTLKRLSIVSPVAATDAVRQTSTLQPTIKWPNDIQLEHRKLGGILIEAEWRDRRPSYAPHRHRTQRQLRPRALGLPDRPTRHQPHDRTRRPPAPRTRLRRTAQRLRAPLRPGRRSRPA